MRGRFEDWKSSILTQYDGAEIREVRQYGGLVGAFAWVGKKHVSSWPEYLKPGYEILHPVPGDYA